MVFFLDASVDAHAVSAGANLDTSVDGVRDYVNTRMADLKQFLSLTGLTGTIGPGA